MRLSINIIVTILSATSLCAQTNYVTDPAGNSYDATTQPAFFWSGFAVGLGFLGFGLILRLARGSAGSRDF
jgi:hypothetical protein